MRSVFLGKVVYAEIMSQQAFWNHAGCLPDSECLANNFTENEAGTLPELSVVPPITFNAIWTCRRYSHGVVFHKRKIGRRGQILEQFVVAHCCCSLAANGLMRISK